MSALKSLESRLKNVGDENTQLEKDLGFMEEELHLYKTKGEHGGSSENVKWKSGAPGKVLRYKKGQPAKGKLKKEGSQDEEYTGVQKSFLKQMEGSQVLKTVQQGEEKDNSGRRLKGSKDKWLDAKSELRLNDNGPNFVEIKGTSLEMNKNKGILCQNENENNSGNVLDSVRTDPVRELHGCSIGMEAENKMAVLKTELLRKANAKVKEAKSKIKRIKEAKPKTKDDGKLKPRLSSSAKRSQAEAVVDVDMKTELNQTFVISSQLPDNARDTSHSGVALFDNPVGVSPGHYSSGDQGSGTVFPDFFTDIDIKSIFSSTNIGENSSSSEDPKKNLKNKLEKSGPCQHVRETGCVEKGELSTNVDSRLDKRRPSLPKSLGSTKKTTHQPTSVIKPQPHGPERVNTTEAKSGASSEKKPVDATSKKSKTQSENSEKEPAGSVNRLPEFQKPPLRFAAGKRKREPLKVSTGTDANVSEKTNKRLLHLDVNLSELTGRINNNEVRETSELPPPAAVDSTTRQPPTQEKVTKEQTRNVSSLLKDIQLEVKGLQYNRDIPSEDTLTVVKELQRQLSEIELKIREQDRQVSPAPGQTTSKPTTVDGSGLISAEKHKAKDISMTADERSDVLNQGPTKPASLPRGMTPKGRKSLSLSMSKRQLIDEIRKEKDEHKRQIRHLESELDRLRNRDPVKTCELNLRDIQFTERDVIGEGAFARVYHGCYQGGEVAVKRLKMPLNALDKNYFGAEVSMLYELRHPRIVLLVGVCTQDKLPLMVLEYMSHGSLCNLLHDYTRNPLDHAQYYQIAKDIALGMNFLHRHKPPVLHLDLKSTNVLIGPGEQAKIADFGFSKFRHEADVSTTGKSKMHPGTPAWMAPELFNGKEITGKVDVFSFAVILWEMLTRQVPHEGTQTFQILEKVQSGYRLPLPASCPQPLSNFIHDCWEQSPNKRPSFENILVHLDTLAFPAEWKALIQAAGISADILEDLQSTRELFSLVTCTLDADHKIPAEPELVNHQQSENQSRRTPGPGVNQGSKKELPVNKLKGQQRLSAKTGASKRDGAENPIPPPPPPPPLVFPTTKLNLKKAGKETFTKANIQRAGTFVIPPLDLIKKKSQLRPVMNPHPSQLYNLKTVSQQKLLSIAEILQKAMSERRSAFHEESSSREQTMTDCGWSPRT